MAYKVDLALSARTYTHGNVQVFLNWCEDAQGGIEPAIWLRRAQGGRSMACVALSDLHRFVKSDGYATALMVSKAGQMAEFIGFSFYDRSAARDIMDVMVEYAADLVRMPGEPPKDWRHLREGGGPKAEMIIQIDGQTVLEQDVDARDVA